MLLAEHTLSERIAFPSAFPAVEIRVVTRDTAFRGVGVGFGVLPGFSVLL